MAAESAYWKNNLNGTLQLLDGTGTPVTLSLTTDRGDLKITGLGPKLNALVPLTRRGKFGSLARGERVFPQITFTAWVGNAVGSSTSAPGTPFEFVNKAGAYSANISTLGANREYTCDLKLTVEGTNFGDTADETITCEDVAWTCEYAEGADGNTISLTGQAMGAIVIVNSTNTVTLAQVA